jgi:hypothetical protein
MTFPIKTLFVASNSWLVMLGTSFKSQMTKHKNIDLIVYIFIATVLLFLAPRLLRADDTYWGLIVHGGKTSYNNGILQVEFRHSPHSAGQPLSYERNVPRGTAAWPDRPMSPQEPSVLFQKMSEGDAMEAKRRLDRGGYWEFWCQNTGKGFFVVNESKGVYAAHSYGNDNVGEGN